MRALSELQSVVRRRSSAAWRAQKWAGRLESAPVPALLLLRCMRQFGRAASHHWPTRFAITPIINFHAAIRLAVPTATARAAQPALAVRSRGLGAPLARNAPLEPERRPVAHQWIRIEQVVASGSQAESAPSVAGRPGTAGGAGPAGRPGARAFPLVIRHATGPSGRHDAEPSAASAPAKSSQLAAPTSAPIAPVLPNLDEITTQVIRHIERRAVAQRERLARS